MAGPPTMPSTTRPSTTRPSTTRPSTTDHSAVEPTIEPTPIDRSAWPESWLAWALEAAASGHPGAREELSAHCLPQLSAFARARGASDPDGIAGTVMVEFLGRLDRLDFASSGQMWAYLYRIARSRVIDERRSAKPIEFREQDSIEALIPPASGLEDAVTERHYVDDLLSSLTSEQREVLQMRFLDDLSIEETATRTGRTLTAVKGLQRRALRALTTAALLSVVVIGGLVLALTDIGRGESVPTVSEGASPSSGFSSDRAETDESATGFDAGGVVEPNDDLAPETSILAGVGDGTADDEAGPTDPFAATFQFAGDDESAGIDRFECSVDGSPFEPCTSPFTVRGLDEGGHLFEVRAVDRTGNVDPTPAREFWIIERPTGVPVGMDLAKLAELRASSDVLECAGTKGTWAELEAEGYDVMVGTDGDDVIDVSGGDRPDFVIGGDGNDTITTGGRADRICGGNGNDTITTGGGDDRVSGGSGNDTIDSGGGDDRVWAGSGTDTVIGGGGNDQINGEGGTDQLDGRQGNDKLRGGGDEPDVLIGGPGDDVCEVPAVDPAPEPEPDPKAEGDTPTDATDETGDAPAEEKPAEVVEPVDPIDTIDASCESTSVD